MSSNIGRRDPCPCGSGKKYKNCCGKQGAKSNSRKWTGLKSGVLAIVIMGGGIAAYMILFKPTTTPPEPFTTEAPLKNVQPLQPQPPGPAPEGKVWSAEHAHWHDKPGTVTSSGSGTNPISISPTAPPITGDGFTPQPPGPPPEGKVWSAEHGHWHDEPGSASEPTPQPPGPAPEGKVWSREHGHWHDAPGAFTPSESGKNPIKITPKRLPETGSKKPD
jgi:hypothetical protein